MKTAGVQIFGWSAICLLCLCAGLLLFAGYKANASGMNQENAGVLIIALALFVVGAWALFGAKLVFSLRRLWPKLTAKQRLIRSGLLLVFFIAPVLTASVFVIQVLMHDVAQKKLRDTSQFAK